MHKTLKDETTRPAARTFLQQQERFDYFVDTFNRVRPHEALGMATPAERYKASTRPYAPKPILYPLHDDVIKVHAGGHTRILKYGGRSFFLSSALADETIGIRQMGDDTWVLTFIDLTLGVYDAREHLFQPADLATSTPPEA